MEDGRLTDGHGRTVDFKNTVVIMTSNLGSQEFQRGSLGFRHETQSRTEQKRLKSSIDGALKQTFRPEFLNRIDEIIIFDPLTEEEIREIVDLMMKEVQARIEDRNITVILTDEAKSWLAEEGFDPMFGARPLRRTIQREVENPLSKKILLGEFKEGDRVKVDSSHEGLVFSKG
jgi:ATP-dependent Clp protease ATP-binding subunit ClpC